MIYGGTFVVDLEWWLWPGGAFARGDEVQGKETVGRSACVCGRVEGGHGSDDIVLQTIQSKGHPGVKRTRRESN